MNTWVYFWVSGPGINGYVGNASLTGLTPGAAAWYGYNWFIPNAKAPGGHNYWAIVWQYSAAGGGWRQVTGWSSPQAFTVAYYTYFGDVIDSWPVYRAGTGLPPIRGAAGCSAWSLRAG